MSAPMYVACPHAQPCAKCSAQADWFTEQMAELRLNGNPWQRGAADEVRRHAETLDRYLALQCGVTVIAARLRDERWTARDPDTRALAAEIARDLDALVKP